MYIETISSNEIEANVHDAASWLANLNGIIDGYKDSCAFTYSGLNLTIGAGMIVWGGKHIQIDATTLAVTAAPISATYDVYLTVDLYNNVVTPLVYSPTPQNQQPDGYTPGSLFTNSLQIAYINLGSVTVSSSQITSASVNEEIILAKGSSLSAQRLYPINSVIMSVGNWNPGNIFPNTLWQQITAGYFIYMLGGSTPNGGVGPWYNGTPIATNATTFTSTSVTITTSHMPAHTHSVPAHSHSGIAHTHKIGNHDHTPRNNLLTTTGSVSKTLNNSTGLSPARYVLRTNNNSVATASATETDGNTYSGTRTVSARSGDATSKTPSTGTVNSSSAGAAQSGHTHYLNHNNLLITLWRRTG